MTQEAIKLVAVDVDGTFVRSDYSYDKPRFKKLLNHMDEIGCRLVVASGNQYYQLRSLFPDDHQELAFVAENGALVKDQDEVLFNANIDRETVESVIDFCDQYPEIQYVLCGLNSAYVERGKISQEFFDDMAIYYHRLQWVDDLKTVEDEILKFGIRVAIEDTENYLQLFSEKLAGKLVPTGSGYGYIDLIVPGCHKASGLKCLVERWGLTPEQCVAFGDGGNDLEMLAYCGRSFAMENAPDNVKAVAKATCPSNEDQGVLTTLEQLFFIG